MLFQARPRANNASFAPPISSKGGTSDARSTRSPPPARQIGNEVNSCRARKAFQIIKLAW